MTSVMSTTTTGGNNTQASLISVSPRVIPIFLKEITNNCSSQFRDEHIKQFTANLNQIFQTKVTDDDVVDLVVSLIGVAQLDDAPVISASSPLTSITGLSSVPTPVAPDATNNTSGGKVLPAVTATTSFHVLRLLKHLFDTKCPFSVQCFRALRKYSEILTRRRAEAEERNASQEASKAKQDALHKAMSAGGGAPPGDLDNTSTSPDRRQSTVSIATSSAESKPVDTHPNLWMDRLLVNDFTRAMLVEIWRDWDSVGIDVTHFSERPECLHLYVPNRKTTRLKVYRDFAMCTARPKLVRRWGSIAACHIKTNIPMKSEVMYRLLVEGYNYGVNAVVFSDVVGYTNRSWDQIGNLEKYGWPEGWDAEMTNDYAPGVAISQYFSTDGFVTVRLRAKSMYCIGFSVSAWLVFHGMGEGFPISVSIHHQDSDL